MSNLIFVLGDQLSLDLSSLQAGDKRTDRILMVEVAEETTYAKHHKQKLVFVLSAMRHFAKQLRTIGWDVDYVKLDAPDNSGSFTGELSRAVQRHKPRAVFVTEPSEYRVKASLENWGDCPLTVMPDNRFICTHAEFESWANDGRKTLRMEYFYRDMRRKTGLLMDGDKPEGGQWNYDAQNRKPAKDDLFMPQLFKVVPDATTREVMALITARFPGHIGTLDSFHYAVTRKDALRALDHFIIEALPKFGDYQDAMLTGEPFLYHSSLSPYINCGLLLPLEVCQAVESAYKKGQAPLNCVEGYIRQIMGWREYIRGIYWLKMPDYEESNYFEARRNLPEFYWTGQTNMACVKAVVDQTIDYAYAHHIQRLMVTGNFAMLAGVDPKQVHDWYLAVYIDAFEWVEMPNVIGMSQFADGGVLGSKPYAASGNYINKMSDYCKTCHYNVSKKTEEDACPFNALYWDFLVRHKDKLGANPRLGHSFRTWNKMSDSQKADYRDRAARSLAALDAGTL